MRILAIGAHPDDIEFGVGGVLIKEGKAGSEIQVAVCTLGESGTSGTPESRKAEAVEAAKFYNAEVKFLDMLDSHMTNVPEQAFKIARLIREFKPNIVIAPSLMQNQHPDHLVAGQISYSACRFARYGGLHELKDLPPHKIDSLYYYAIHAELGGSKPDIIVDVTEVHKEWEQAMAAHTSQMKTKAYLDLVNSKARYIGKAVGVEFAMGLWSNDPIRVDNLSDLSLSSRNY